MKVLKWLDKYFEIIYLVLALAAIVVIMTTQIICRKFFDVSLAWTEECCRHLFIGMGIWGIALTIRENSAIKFDLIVDFLPSKGKAIFGLPSYNVYLSMKATSATVMPYNMDLVYGFLALGFFMVIVRSCQMCVINLKKILSKRNGEQEVEKQ